MKGVTMRPMQMQEQMHRRGRNNCIDRIGRGRRRDVEHRNDFLVQASILECSASVDWIMVLCIVRSCVEVVTVLTV